MFAPNSLAGRASQFVTSTQTQTDHPVMEQRADGLSPSWPCAGNEARSAMLAYHCVHLSHLYLSL